MKYSDYINRVHFKHKTISYNLLTKDSSVNKKIKVSWRNFHIQIYDIFRSKTYPF